jgi:hypothetical protein
MLSKKLVLSILLLIFFVHSSEQLTISEAEKDKIKRKIAEVINLFKDDMACKEPKWCEGFKVDTCESPLTNTTACCLYCVKAVGGKVAVKTTTVSTTTHNFDADKITLPDTSAADGEEDKITLPETSSDDEEADVTTTESVPVVKTTKEAVVSPVVVVDAKDVKHKDVAKPHVLTEMLLEVDTSDPNEIIVFKKSFERVPKECPKEVGVTGCTIVEKCHINSDCSKLERCCLKNCVRSCISI